MTGPDRQTPNHVQAPPAEPRGWRLAWAIANELIHEGMRQPISLLAKQAAYSLLYAIPSILIVLMSITAMIDEETSSGLSEMLLELINRQVPEDLQPLFRALVDNAMVEISQSTATITAVISFGVALWGGAGGVGALILACNLVYNLRDTRSWFARTILRLVLVVVGGVLVILAVVLFAFGQRVGEWIAEWIDYDSILVDVLISGRGWSVVLIACSLLLLYTVAPNAEHAVIWTLPGTFAATAAIAVIFAALDLIFAKINPGSAYGAASSVLILLWVLWLLSTIVVAGAMANAVFARRFDRTFAADLVAHPEKRRDDPSRRAGIDASVHEGRAATPAV